MLVAYYSKGCDSGALFAGRKAEKEASFQEHLNQHNVIRLDMQRFLFDEAHLNIFIDKIQEAVVQELRTEYADCFETDQYGLPSVLEQIYFHTGKGFIFIIDEWDCVFRLAKDRKDIQKDYLDFLRGLFKGAEYVDLAYITGILPIKKYGEHSAINIFDEYSMIDSGELSGYFGFTEDEVRELCAQNDIEFSELQKWYDGYLLNGLHIYNPKSVVDVMRRKKFRSYWTGTETYRGSFYPKPGNSILKYNDENSLACTVLMAYYSAKSYYMNPIMELPSGKGFADVVYLPKREIDCPALVVELKWNKSAEGAISQIKNRQYAAWIEGYTGKILLVGINYSENKEHTCIIEEYVK